MIPANGQQVQIQGGSNYLIKKKRENKHVFAFKKLVPGGVLVLLPQ